MFNCLVVGLTPASWIRSVALLGPMRAVKSEAKALPGFAGARIFKQGPYQFAVLSWDNSRSFQVCRMSEAMAGLEQAVAKSGSVCEIHGFVFQTLPSRAEVAQLWCAARYAAVA